MLPASQLEGKGDVSDTRERILNATRALYASKGSRGTTTRQVADRAEVNEATVFRHFGTKQHLLAVMLDHFNGEPMLSELFEQVRRSGTIEAQLRRLALFAVDTLRRKEDLIKIAMAEEIANPERTTCVWRVPTEARGQVTAFFVEKVAAGELQGDPDLLSSTFMSLFFSFVMARTLWAELGDTPQEQVVVAMVEIFLNGARAN